MGCPELRLFLKTGDPCPGKDKILQITYELVGNVKRVAVGEDKNLVIDIVEEWKKTQTHTHTVVHNGMLSAAVLQLLFDSFYVSYRWRPPPPPPRRPPPPPPPPRRPPPWRNSCPCYHAFRSSAFCAQTVRIGNSQGHLRLSRLHH